jgi:hypothetical protein
MADGEEARSGHLRISAAGGKLLSTAVLEYGVSEVTSRFTTAEKELPRPDRDQLT